MTSDFRKWPPNCSRASFLRSWWERHRHQSHRPHPSLPQLLERFWGQATGLALRASLCLYKGLAALPNTAGSNPNFGMGLHKGSPAAWFEGNPRAMGQSRHRHLQIPPKQPPKNTPGWGTATHRAAQHTHRACPRAHLHQKQLIIIIILLFILPSMETHR